jgi:hypothetical protein
MDHLDKSSDPLRRILRGAFTIFVALFIFLEEWIWDSLTAAMAWLGRLPPVHWAEARIARLPPYAAMVTFLIPAAILLPFKLAAFWLIARGHAMLGLEVFVIAKIVGTAFLARIFALTKPQLLTIAWFARFHAWFTGWRDRVYAYVKSLPAWLAAKAWIARVKDSARHWYRERFGS